MPEPLWYKDAIVYELHVKAFHDTNNDGIGDFRGLTEKLDYLESLGITCIWLLPFYPSPLRDDGYDISWYQGIHPSYGTLADFRVFLEQAHKRGLHVLTELVVNHTSDQHPWFRAARTSPAGSPLRDFYVWSDTKQRYQDARVIFTDSETSNWTWDPVAGAYYWHRFFHHQPDLNYDNPAVVRAILKVMKFWFDMGVDGLRLDAVPYLIEREGTNCENLSETHDVLRRIRAEVDAHYPNRLLLAEANQWPADVRAYFGEGDECQMAFHFPLMPRMFMAVEQEDRHPISEILDQTPDIPENCQWALFLRNHDELTLEMVTDEERDYMYRTYAADPRMRLNLGIRRRLAPLVQNSRRRIELLKSLLFSLPGTPVIYYGDEIGMGDNIYLGDRNGVRTPMQWTSDRNAGFSRADPAALFAPVIMDPLYGYQAVNVEAQDRSPWSLLQWMRRMLRLRRQHRTFGRGSLRILQPANRKILSFIRQGPGETILVVANLARSVQPVELDLGEFKGLTPIEMLGRTEFPRIGSAPYFLVLGPFAFYWFLLVEQPAAVSSAQAVAQAPEGSAPLPVLLASGVWDTLLEGHVRHLVERHCLPRYLARQAWFGGGPQSLKEVQIVDWAVIRRGREPAFLAVGEVRHADDTVEQWLLPLVADSGETGEQALKSSPERALARITGARKGILHDGIFGSRLGAALVDLMAGARRLATHAGEITGMRTESMAAAVEASAPLDGLPATAVRAGKGGRTLLVGDRTIVRLTRRMEPGPDPDLEIGQQLSERIRFPRVPPVLGALFYQRPGREQSVLAVAHRLVPHQADGWAHATEELSRYFDRVASLPGDVPALPPGGIVEGASVEPSPAVRDAMGAYLQTAAKLGTRTAELHLALAADTANPAFAPETFPTKDLAVIAARIADDSKPTLEALERAMPGLDGRVQRLARRVLDERSTLIGRLIPLSGETPGGRIRVHGNYRLGRVLWAEDDFYVFGFEGEPWRSLAERRAKQSPLKDVAGMIFSFGCVAWNGLEAFAVAHPIEERLAGWARAWQQWASAAFLGAYLQAAGHAGVLPDSRDAIDHLLRIFIVERAFCELRYELTQRPERVSIPLGAIVELLGR